MNQLQSRSSIDASGRTVTVSPMRCASQCSMTRPSAARGRLVEAEIERQVEGVGTSAIAFGIVADQDVQLLRRLFAEHRRERRGMRVDLGAVNRLFIGEEQGAVVDRQALRAEEHLGRAQHEGVILLVERVAEDRVHELIDEQRRRPTHALANQREVSRLDRSGGNEPIAEIDQQPPVLLCVGIENRGDLADSSTGSSGAIVRRACRARSAAQASSGGITSGLA